MMIMMMMIIREQNTKENIWT